jgi:hypothetical protein
MSRTPSHNGQNLMRDARIAKLYAAGVGTRALAERFRLTQHYVSNIVTKAKRQPT